MSSKSKCWSCKHGLCVFQKTNLQQTIVEEEDQQEFEVFDTPVKSNDPKHYKIKTEGQVSFCLWPLSHNDRADMIQLEDVRECNRYEKKD